MGLLILENGITRNMNACPQFVDGAHEAEPAFVDLMNMWRMSSKAHSVVVMDDTNCAMPWCKGPMEAWDRMVQAGRLRLVREPVEGVAVLVGQYLH